MTTGDPETRKRTAASPTRWTPRRTKLAGLGCLVGGVGSLLGSLLGLGLAGIPIGSMGTGVTTGAVIVLYPILHVLMAAGVPAANARHGPRYGRRGRIVAALLTLALVGEAGSILVLMVGRMDLGGLLLPIGIVHGTIWLTIRLLGSLYGVSLWRHAGASRLTAGSFVVLFPAIFVLGPLTQVGFPGVLIPAPLYLAFIALGYELWTAAGDAPARGTEVTG